MVRNHGSAVKSDAVTHVKPHRNVLPWVSSRLPTVGWRRLSAWTSASSGRPGHSPADTVSEEPHGLCSHGTGKGNSPSPGSRPSRPDRITAACTKCSIGTQPPGTAGYGGSCPLASRHVRAAPPLVRARGVLRPRLPFPAASRARRRALRVIARCASAWNCFRRTWSGPGLDGADFGLGRRTG